MKKIRNILFLLTFLVCSVMAIGQTRDNYVMMADLTGYPRTYDAAAEVQMDTIKQLLTAIDPTTSDFKVFETGVYRLNEYFEDAAGIEAKIKATFDEAYPDQRNYILFYKLVNSKDEFASIKVITSLNINNSCFDKVKFERDLNFFYQYSGINPKDLGPVIVSALEYVKFKIRRLECCANVTSRVGTKREVNSICSLVDIVEVEDSRLANLYFYSHLKCKVGVTTLVANNLPNYQDKLDPSTYKFVSGSDVIVAKIGTFYYSFYKFPPGVGPPDANDPKYNIGYLIPNLTEDYTVETRPALGTGVSGLSAGITIQAKFYTFIIKLGTEFYVVKTTSPNLVLQGLDQPKDYEKLFTGIVDDPSLFTSGYLCDIPERLERTCNTKEFVNYLKNVLKYSAYNFQYFRHEDLLNKAYTSFNKCTATGFESLARHFYENPCDLKELVEGTGGGNQQFVEVFYKNIFQKYPFGLNSTTELDIRITGGNIWPTFTDQYKIVCQNCKVILSPLSGYNVNPNFIGSIPQPKYNGGSDSFNYSSPIIIPTATVSQLGTMSNVSKNIIPAGMLCKAQNDQFWQRFSTTVDVASIAFGGYYLYLGRAANAVNALRRTHKLEGILGIASGSGNLFIKSGNCPNKGFCDALSNVLTMIGYLEIGLGLKDLVTSAFYKQLDEQVDAILQGPELKNIEGSTEISKTLNDASKTLKAIRGVKASLLLKLNKYPNLKDWVLSLDEIDDLNLLNGLNKLEEDYLRLLDLDLGSQTFSTELKTFLKESPNDLTDIWKRLKDDPKYSFELAKTGGSRWEKWAQGNFFKTVTKAGKDFETNVCLPTFKNRRSDKYLELKQKFQTDFDKNLDEYEMYSQVQLKYDGENYFVADQLFVKRNALGDIDDLVVIENKLSSSTPLTTPQATAFTKNSFTVRSVSIESATTPGKFLNSGQSLNFSDTKQWYKVYDGAKGDVISGISKMN